MWRKADVHYHIHGEDSQEVFCGAARLTRLSPSSCPVNNKSHVLWCASLCSSRLGFVVFKFGEVVFALILKDEKEGGMLRKMGLHRKAVYTFTSWIFFS